MPLTTVVEKLPVFTAFRFGGTQADIDALNTYLGDSGWSATFIDAATWRITGPYGSRTFGTQPVIVFVSDHAGVRAVAKYPSLAAAQQRFT